MLLEIKWMRREGAGMTKRDQAKAEKKMAIRRFVEEYIADYHMSPSMANIAQELGINRTTVWRYLREMDDEDQLQYDGEEVSTDITEKYAFDQVRIPVAGSIPYGTPEEQNEDVEVYYSFPRMFVGSGEFFMLRAVGDSMVDAGIDSGDMVIIRRQAEARNGQIVAALVENSSTLKTFVKKDDFAVPYLHPENEEAGYPDIHENFSIQGVAVKIIKDC